MPSSPGSPPSPRSKAESRLTTSSSSSRPSSARPRSGTTIRSGSRSASALCVCELAKKFADKHKLFEQTGTANDFKFLWVTDFPMYEWDEETKIWNAAHHPFTSPHEDDIKAGRLTNDKGAVRALAYDIVLNGTELGSGSIRIHRQGRAGGDLPLARHVG